MKEFEWIGTSGQSLGTVDAMSAKQAVEKIISRLEEEKGTVFVKTVSGSLRGYDYEKTEPGKTFVVKFGDGVINYKCKDRIEPTEMSYDDYLKL